MDKKDRERMASFIKEKRNAWGYTQEYVAERSGISYSYYTKIENGKIVTDQLKDKLLKPGESATIELTLTWINDENNMGVIFIIYPC